MTIFLYIALITIGLFAFLVGVLALRVSKKKGKLPNKVTYGRRVKKHMLLTGISVEHGMVVTKTGKLQAQSKPSEGQLEAMLLK